MTTAHVTGIRLGLNKNGVIYTVEILGDSISRTVYPTAGCSLVTTFTFTIGTNQRVKKIRVWRKDDNLKWYRMKIVLNDLTT